MQAGFAMLEAGIVHPKNVTNILFKNMIDASLAAFVFWAVGYGVAYGNTGGGFIGTSIWGIGTKDCAIRASVGSNSVSDGWEAWFIQWGFVAKAVSIVAGSVAERTAVHAYFIYSCVFSIFIYPVVAHWVWGQGFLSWYAAIGAGVSAVPGYPKPILFGPSASNGLIDFAGCGVVHMVGGFTGMVGAIIIGPRTGRFVDGQVVELYSGNKTLQALGTFILWFGWYGFNCGSTLGLAGGMANVAAKVAVNTTLGAAMGGIVTTFIGKLIFGCYDISMGLNGVLAGLVSVTANCHLVEPWHAIVIGSAAGIILLLGHFLLKKMRIDDPCDATVVHGFCGIWGLWAAGIFCIDSNVVYMGGGEGGIYPASDACKTGQQFAVQIVGSLCIFAWTVGTAAIMFLIMKYTVGVRISQTAEDMGLDASEHGAGFLADMGELEPAKPPPTQQFQQPAAMIQQMQPPVSQYAPVQYVHQFPTNNYPISTINGTPPPVSFGRA
jgi:Amt family ammonium transporter